MKRALIAAAWLSLGTLPATAGEPGLLSRLRETVGIGAPSAPEAGAAREAIVFPASSRVDLSGQFPDAATRSQTGAGACHAFGAVALLEAAWYRQHGERARLSEADLFMRATVLSGRVYEDFERRGDARFHEGNQAASGAEFAIRQGVARSLEYERFIDLYREYRDLEEGTLAFLNAFRRREPWPVRLLGDSRRLWLETVAGDPVVKAEAEALLTGGRGGLEQEREHVRRRLAGMAVWTRDFPYLGEQADAVGPDLCRIAGTAQRSALLAELDAGRPVSVDMSLGSLPGWEGDGEGARNHTFVVTGYSAVANGLVFQTRNSWEGRNPDVGEEQLCRVFFVASVRTPSDERSPMSSGLPASPATQGEPAIAMRGLDGRSARALLAAGKAGSLKPGAIEPPSPSGAASPPPGPGGPRPGKPSWRRWGAVALASMGETLRQMIAGDWQETLAASYIGYVLFSSCGAAFGALAGYLADGPVAGPAVWGAVVGAGLFTAGWLAGAVSRTDYRGIARRILERP